MKNLIIAIVGSLALAPLSAMSADSNAHHTMHAEHNEHMQHNTHAQTIEHNTHMYNKMSHVEQGKPNFTAIFAHQMHAMHGDMEAFKQARDQDSAFILGMIPHHQGAIDMARVLEQNSKDESMIQLAKNIIAAQNKEIALMQNLLKTLDHNKTTKENLKEAFAEYEKANAQMHKDVNGSAQDNVDVAFAKAMIPHHQGAIDMAEIYLKYGKNEKLIKLCKDIIAEQSKEIDFMSSFIK